ncbi:hypothetical protein Hanom_Chr12g01137111 [Helianthus anomalus]
MPSLSSSTSNPEKQNTKKKNKKKYSHLYFIFPFKLCNTDRISAYAISQPRSRRLFLTRYATFCQVIHHTHHVREVTRH